MVLLKKDEIVKRWPVIGQTIVGLFDKKYDYNKIGENLLKALMDGRMQLWVLLDSENNIKGSATTLIREDVSGIYDLLIYSTWGFKKLTKEDLQAAMGVLMSFAVANRCANIVFYTVEKSILKIVKMFNPKYEVFISLEVPDANILKNSLRHENAGDTGGGK